MINLGLITQFSPYTLQNQDGFFYFRCDFLLFFIHLTGKINHDVIQKFHLLLWNIEREPIFHIIHGNPWNLLASSIVETRYPNEIIKKAWITPWWKFP